MNPTISFRFHLVYCLFALAIALGLNDWIYICASLFLLVFIWYWHSTTKRKKQEMQFYGNCIQPIVVIDWGAFGRSFDLPEHLRGQWVAVTAYDVEEKASYICAMLEQVNNYLFCSPPVKQWTLPVYRIYYRHGEFCNETPEQYKDRVIGLMNYWRVEYHKLISTPHEKIDDTWYLENYLRSGHNGSIE